MSAPKGNQFAAKPAETHVKSAVLIRGTEAEREAWRKAATGQSFSRWARNALNKATQTTTTTTRSRTPQQRDALRAMP